MSHSSTPSHPVQEIAQHAPQPRTDVAAAGPRPRRVGGATSSRRGAEIGLGSVPMFAVYAAEPNADDPLDALRVGERPDPEVPDGLGARSRCARPA